MSKQLETQGVEITINGRRATNVEGARNILNRRATEELGVERDYEHNSIQAMWRAGRIQGEQTPSAIFYFIDSLERVPLTKRRVVKPTHYTRRVGKGGYPQEMKDRVFDLHRQGHLSQRAIARELGISHITVSNWLKEAERTA